MHPQLLVYGLWIVTLSGLAPIEGAYAQDGSAHGKGTANSCPEYFEGLLNAKSLAQKTVFPWSSADHQALRVRAALDGNLNPGSPRLRDIIEILRRQRTRPSLELDHKDILVALEELGTAKPTVVEFKGRVVYANPGNGEVLIEDPLCGCFWKDKLSNLDAPGFGDIIAFIQSGGTVYSYRGFPSHTIGDLKTHERIERGLAKAFAQSTQAARSITERIQDFASAWEKRSLREAVRRFLGTEYRATQDAYKTQLVNDRTGFVVYDDPFGEYFRVYVGEGPDRVYLDWNGHPVTDSDADYARSHFNYSTQTHEHATSLSPLQDELKNYRPQIASEKPTPAELALARSPSRSAGARSGAASVHGSEPLTQAEAYKQILIQSGFKRSVALDQLDWKALSKEEQDRLLNLARSISDITTPEISYLRLELPGFARLASRSEDPRWIPILENWEEHFSYFTRGWPLYAKEPVGKSLKELRRKSGVKAPPLIPVRPGSPAELALFHPIARTRVETLKTLRWEALAPQEQSAILLRASQQVVTPGQGIVANPLEIGEYIELAARSKDSRWYPILNEWYKEWSPLQTGWQARTRHYLNQVRKTLKPAVDPEQVTRTQTAAEVQVALTSPSIKKRLTTLEDLNWEVLSAEEKGSLLKRAESLSDPKTPVDQWDTTEIAAFAMLAAKSGDPQWIPVLSQWKDLLSAATTGWPSVTQRKVEIILAQLKSPRESLSGYLALNPKSPIFPTLFHFDPNARSGFLGRTQWQSLAPLEQDLLIARANQLDLTHPEQANPSIQEVKAYIRFAQSSNDPRWIPVLERWEKEWKEIEAPWKKSVIMEIRGSLGGLRSKTKPSQ